jgi:hypothetical protein
MCGWLGDVIMKDHASTGNHNTTNQGNATCSHTEISSEKGIIHALMKNKHTEFEFDIRTLWMVEG